MSEVQESAVATGPGESALRPRNAPDEERSLVIADSVVERLRQLRASEGDSDLMLRVAVDGGGCSGFQYRFGFADDIDPEEDRIFERAGVQVVVDDVSLDLLTGSTVAFKRDLMGAMFVVENPNAASSCGCGSSFNIAF